MLAPLIESAIRKGRVRSKRNLPVIVTRDTRHQRVWHHIYANDAKLADEIYRALRELRVHDCDVVIGVPDIETAEVIATLNPVPRHPLLDTVAEAVLERKLAELERRKEDDDGGK